MANLQKHKTKKTNEPKRTLFHLAIDFARRGNVVCVSDLVNLLVSQQLLSSRAKFYKWFPSGSKNYKTIHNALEAGKASTRQALDIQLAQTPKGLEFLRKLYATDKEAANYMRFTSGAKKDDNKDKGATEPPIIEVKYGNTIT